MAKLVLSLNSIIQREYEINQERLVIGRKPDVDIQIDSLQVSGKHALIITMLNDSFLEDLGSTNGSYVNGKLTNKHALKNCDVITIGRHEITYINEHATSDDDIFEKTISIKSDLTSAVVASATTSIDVGMPLCCLSILNGPNAGKEMDLSKALITLGKKGLQVAEIACRPEGYFLTQTEGDNVLLVNSEEIDAKEYKLKDSDLIELAGIKMQFLQI
jgi:predicted component of type VI protein secretion system